MEAETTDRPTRAQKVIRRTLVGGSITLVTAGMLYLVRGEDGPLIVHAFAALLLLGSVWEMARLTGDAPRSVLSLGAASLMGWLLVYELLAGGAAASAVAALDLHFLARLTCATLTIAATASAVQAQFSREGGIYVALSTTGVAFWLVHQAPAPTLVSISSGLLVILAVFAARPSASRAKLRAVLADLVRALWFVPALAGLALVHFGFGLKGLIALIVLSKSGDIFGYFGGNLFGRHHPLPRLSPGKTSEGFACSMLGGVGVGMALAHWGHLPGEEVSLVQGALLGGILNIAAQAGDLIESWVKRRHGVKDSGALFGPTGGFLDLLDSFFLTVPVALIIGLLTRG